MSEQPSAFLQVERQVTEHELEQIKARWQEHHHGQVTILPQPDRDFPDTGRREDERTWWARRRERRRRDLQREIAVLECDLGIACDEQPCTHWLKMEWVSG